MTEEIDFRYGEDGAIKRLIWATDLHLDAIDRAQYHSFFDLVSAYEPDCVLIGGDISNGIASLMHLKNLAKLIDKEFYFVLGNHDFYYGSIVDIRTHAKHLSEEVPSVHYLTDNGIIELTAHTALIGHDGWSDGRSGDFLHSDIMLNDYFLIDELKRLNQEERLQKLHQLGDEAALYLKTQTQKAFEKYDNVVLLTHVPPFTEACLYEGQPCDYNWCPHFVCKAAGDALEEVMKEHENKRLLVLCGHCHWGNDLYILPNLRVVTGHSELGIPNVQGLVFVN